MLTQLDLFRAGTSSLYSPRQAIAVPDKPLIPLRPYQLDAVEAVRNREMAGVKRQLIVLPTGCGKTLVFSELIRQRLPGRALIVAHRDELIQQARDKFKMVAGNGIDIGIVKAESNHVHSQVVIASVQTLSGQRRLDQMARDFSIIIIDEAHHATAPSYRRIVDYFGDNPLIIGVTATPDRADKIGLGAIFDEIVYEKKLLDMIADGYLCDLEAIQVPMPVNLDTIKVTAGDWEAEALGNAMVEADAHHHIARSIKEFASDRHILAFAPNVSLAYELATTLNEYGIKSTGIDGKTPIDERRRILERYAAREFQCVVNMGVLTEGFDLPSIDCIVMARPTKSRSLYQQCIGRGSRLFPQKDNCLILDFVGISTKHKLQTLSSLIGLPVKETPDEKRASLASGSGTGKSVLSLLKEWGGIITDPDGSKRAVSVDLFENSWARWLPAQNGMWALPAGDSGMMAIQPNPMGLFDVWEMPKQGRPRKVADSLDLGYAQGMAEDRVRESAEMLAQRDAEWRNHPRSDGQEWKLKQLGIDPTLYRTKGDASDAITVAEAMRRMAML